MPKRATTGRPRRPGAAAPASAFAGDSALAARCRAFDWAATPLGPVAAWPQSLRTTVQGVLASGFASIVLWGPELAQVYNDAYAPYLGVEDATALGAPTRAVRPEVWAFNAPIYARVRAGETVTLVDQRYTIDRRGPDAPSEALDLTITYAPVRDEAGAVAGVLVTLVDTTAQVAGRAAEAALRAGAARQAFLLQLGDALRPLADPVMVQATAARVLGEHLGVQRAFYTEVDGTGPDAAYVFVGHYACDVPPLPPGRYPVEAFGEAVVAPLRDGRAVRVEDTEADPRFDAAQRAAYRGASIRAHAAVPLVKDGRLVALFGVHAAAARSWGDAELALVAETAERTWAAVERARAEAALRASEARFRTVQDASPLGFAIHRPIRAEGAPGGPVVDFATPYINAAGARIVQQTPAAVMTGTLLGFWPSTAEEGVFSDYVRVLATGAPSYRELLYERDGLAAGLAITAVRIGDGPHAELGVTFADVTARLRTERERDRLLGALSAERERLRSLILHMPTPVALAEGPEHRFTVVNAAYQRVSGGRDVTGLTPREVFPALARQSFADLFDQVYATGEAWAGPETLVRVDRDGTGVQDTWFDLALEPVRDADGQVTGVLSFGVQVTDQVRARRDVERLLGESERARAAAEAAGAAAAAATAEAERANAAKSQFLANMSHELRTPLNAIGGYTQLVDMGLHGPVTDAQRLAFGRVQSAQRHLLGLINDVLNYAKLEGGRVEYHVAAVDVREVVADVVPLVAPQVAVKGLTLAVQLPDGPASTAGCLVWADREKLGQVLVNLLSNAIKFTDVGPAPARQAADGDPAPGAPGQITITVATRAGQGDVAGDAVFLRVTDTGRGIARDQQDAVFDPFVQVDQRFTRTQQGTGLGLAISRDLTRGMGGNLRVRSTPGDGATFTVALRRATDDVGHATERRTRDERRETERRSGAARRGKPDAGP